MLQTAVIYITFSSQVVAVCRVYSGRYTPYVQCATRVIHPFIEIIQQLGQGYSVKKRYLPIHIFDMSYCKNYVSIIIETLDRHRRREYLHGKREIKNEHKIG